MNPISLILMLAAAAMMVFGLQKSKQGYEWGKPVTIAGAAIALLLALGSMFTSKGPNPQKLSEYQSRYREACGAKLGMYLAEQFPDAKAAFLMPHNMNSPTSQHSTDLVDALKNAMEDTIQIGPDLVPTPPPEIQRQHEEMREQLGSQDVPPEQAMMYMTPMFSWFSAEQLDDLVAEKAADCDLLIAIAELPQDFERCRFPTKADAPKIVLTGGAIYRYAPIIESGVIVAAIANNPEANWEPAPPPKKVEAAFDERYLLVTPDNINKIAEKYPDLIPSEEEEE